MLGSIPHQKFRFYHLPTRGRSVIKLGDASYVSNVSIIFDCSMLLYYPFWMFMGFTLHFYIIFGTNLLTGGPARIVVFFAYFSVSKKRNIKQNETFGSDLFETNATQETWSGCQEAAAGGGRAPHPRGPLERPPTYFFLLFRKHQKRPRKTISTAVTFCTHEIPSWSLRRCSTRGESTTEGHYIISKALPMSCG